jgi:hypothetical protein
MMVLPWNGGITALNFFYNIGPMRNGQPPMEQSTCQKVIPNIYEKKALVDVSGKF